MYTLHYQRKDVNLEELLVAKSGPIVSTQVQNFLCRVPEATDVEIKQHILECFSNVGTRTEAHHYLTRMTLDEDESLRLTTQNMQLYMKQHTESHLRNREVS